MSSNPHIQRIRERISAVTRVDELKLHDMWNVHGPLLWQAKRFRGQPSFYPVYRAGDLYSYSPLALILAKGRIQFDAKLSRQCNASRYFYLSGRGVLDREVERIGGPMTSTNEIRSSDVYVDRIVAGLLSDVAAAERANSGHTNVVLCGGKDSLNLLLLPWRNPTYAASAPPNFELVRQFVADNKLDLDVVRLDDMVDDDVLDAEVLENGCRNNLMHCRWGVDLYRLAQKHDNKLIFWKGQLGDLMMTPHWKEVAHPPGALNEKGRRAYTRFLEGRLPEAARQHINHSFLEPRFRQVLWQRSAMWQGAHVSLIRAVTDCLVLSGYHGPAMEKTFSEVHLTAAASADVRDDVGARLLGRTVIYPRTNPGPKPSRVRENRSSPEMFLSMLEALDVAVLR